MFLLKRTFGFASSSENTTVTSDPKNEDDVVKPPEQQPEAGSVGATLWSILSSKLGGDVLTAGISLPSWLYEPLSILQRQAEMVEYSQVLTQAARCTDSIERLAYTAGFAVSGYSATQRYKTDFNPLLGETFEYIDPRNDTRFFAEQVCHHPPISALHVTNGDNWVFWQNSSPITRFLGNCIDLDTQGKSHILFPKFDEHYFYTNPQCTRIHNIILGSMWIEHFGVLHIKNMDGSVACTINFKKSGLFQGTQFKVEGYIEDKNGKKLVKLEGRWDEYLEGKWLEDTENVKKGEVRKLWVIARDTFLNDQYNFTQYSKSLNDFDQEMENILLPTDSRRRLDRRYLEIGDTDSATYWKKIMEDRQRQDRKIRKDAWRPVWFKKEEPENGESKAIWVYKGDYWEQRSEKIAFYKEGKDTSFFLQSSQILGLACDFTSYTSYPKSSLPRVPVSESDTTLDQDTTTDTTTDTNTINTTDDDRKDDDTDTETELEGWIPDNKVHVPMGPTADVDPPSTSGMVDQPIDSLITASTKEEVV